MAQQQGASGEMSTPLPPGFTLDQPQNTNAAPSLPAGFVVDQPQQQPNSIYDALRSIPGGLAHGAAALIGLPEDLRELANRGADKASEFVAGMISPEAAARRRRGVGGWWCAGLPGPGRSRRAAPGGARAGRADFLGDG